MTPEQIAELERLDKERTQGEWFTADWSDYGDNTTTVETRSPEILRPGQSSIWPGGIAKTRVADTSEGDNPIPDAAFIAALANAAPALLSDWKRMREALEFYRDNFVKHYKRGPTGLDHSTWKPTEALLDDCGERALAALEPSP